MPTADGSDYCVGVAYGIDNGEDECRGGYFLGAVRLVDGVF